MRTNSLEMDIVRQQHVPGRGVPGDEVLRDCGQSKLPLCPRNTPGVRRVFTKTSPPRSSWPTSMCRSSLRTGTCPCALFVHGGRQAESSLTDCLFAHVPLEVSRFWCAFLVPSRETPTVTSPSVSSFFSAPRTCDQNVWIQSFCFRCTQHQLLAPLGLVQRTFCARGSTDG